MSFSNTSIVVTHAAYARPHRSGPRRPHLSFRPVPEVVHRFVDKRDPCAFGDGVPGAQNPRRPRIVALEDRRGGKRNERVYECEFVMELPDACEAFRDQRDRLSGSGAARGSREHTAPR